MTASDADPAASFVFPLAPVTAVQPAPAPLEGAGTRQAWIAADAALTTMQILDPIRASLVDQGFAVAFECADIECGGFDFRYALRLLPEPEMHVDLGDFRYLYARSPDEIEHVAVVVSRSDGAANIHISRLGPSNGNGFAAALPAASAATADAPELALPETGPGATGTTVLEDVAFETGSATLGGPDYPSLETLAAFLAENPLATVVFVGHTDAVGDLDSNVALSRRRAEAVAEQLIGFYAIPASRVSAEGVGYLAPRASNQTPEGRAANRRVEALILLPGGG
ncbi:MAG: OmpA family protein [Alphaproteobacteria bacterium]|nr:OmpA family protein [Alphaproteobacteria bacterium]NNF24766.1 OmpA family protein [Paracoccaceae bacterium]